MLLAGQLCWASDALLHEMRAASRRVGKILSVLRGTKNTYSTTCRIIATTARYRANQNGAGLSQ